MSVAFSKYIGSFVSFLEGIELMFDRSFLRLNNTKAMSAMDARTAIATPTPMPASAPVLRLLDVD